MDHAEEFFDMVFPSGDEAAEVVHPGEEPFDLPAFSVAAKRSSILCFAAIPAVGCDHLDAVFGFECCVERVRVIGLVADQPRGEFVEEAAGEHFFDKVAFRRRSALHRYGDWKTVISGDSDDLRALARRVGPTARPPFLRSRRLHPRTPPRYSTSLARATAWPTASEPLPACPRESTAGTGDGRSGTEGISPATRATARPCPILIARRSKRLASHTADDRGGPAAAQAATPAPPRSTVLGSTPSVQSSALAETHRAPSECNKSALHKFMRLVVVNSSHLSFQRGRSSCRRILKVTKSLEVIA